MAVVPSTKARLQPYIKIYNQGNRTTPIGAIQRLDLKIDRPTDMWRELNTDREGKPVEVYPGLPTYKATMQRIVLYKAEEATLLRVFGFGTGSGENSGFDIVDQKAPLEIAIELSVPAGETPKTVILHNVWFENAPLQFNINDTDMRIEQEISATFSGLTVS